MLYLGIDQHRKQLTVCIRNEQGDVILRRQVSTQWERVRAFLAEIGKRAGKAGFVVIVEVCGFNDWLVKLLKEYGCREVLLIQPEKAVQEEDRPPGCQRLGRGALGQPPAALGGQAGPGGPPHPAADRAGGRRPAAHGVAQAAGPAPHADDQQGQAPLRKHNLEQECPTKGIDTIKAKKWLAKLSLGRMDRLEMDLLLAQWKLWDEQIERWKRRSSASGREQDGGGDRHGPRLRGVQQPGVGLADRLDRAVPAAEQPGQLLGPDAGLPQLGRGDRPPGLDHQARQRHGPLHPRAVGAARLAAGRLDAGLVPEDQEASRVEDRPGGGDASAGDDPLAHGQAQRTVHGGRSAAAEAPQEDRVSQATEHWHEESGDEVFAKASVRKFRRPRAGEQGDEAPPPAPPTLSSVPGLGRPVILKRTHPTGHHSSVGTPRQNKQRIRRKDGCIGPSLVEEALAGKASLRCHVDSAAQAERQAD